MKKFKYIIASFVAVLFFSACQEDDASIGNIIAPSNVSISAEILGVDADNPNGDGSGLVKFTVSADNALSYNIQFGDGMSDVVASGEITHRYSITGLNSYTAVVNAIGTGGLSSSAFVELEVFSSFDDAEAKQFLTGGPGNSRTWYWAAAEPGHLGVGPANGSIGDGFWYPQWYAAQPFEKAGAAESSCLYEDELIFSQDANSQLFFELNNNGMTYFNGAHEGVAGGSAGFDFCYDFDTSGTSLVSLSPTNMDWSTVADPDFVSRGTLLNFDNNNFMGYYVGSSTYEIISISNTRMVVRTYDSLNSALAWYHTFSTSPPTEDFESIYNTLVWEDNFDTNGAPNPANWTYDLGAGGWGNQELQSYTNNAENVIVEDGFLKITAKADGSGYTSARLKSEDLYEFTYGRVEVRAKLPSAGGTWPAIWMLGQDYATNTWPACGEIDIMEHVGNDLDVVLGTLHYPGVSPGGGNSGSTIVSNATTEFHDYTVEWTPDVIKFLVDGTVYHTFANTPSTPFNSDFFLILNIAMGGTLGGTIDPGFTQDTMEIDYIKVYQ